MRTSTIHRLLQSIFVIAFLFSMLGVPTQSAGAVAYITISGTTGVAGTTITYTGGTTTADGTGAYTFSVAKPYTGTVTPSKTGYTFTPPSRTYTGATGSQTGQNYTGVLIQYTISGNAGIAGATITYTGGSTTADGSGNYSFMVDYGWTGTVTPSLAGYTFDPLSKDYTTVTANATGQDYTATLNSYSISGNAGVAGATITYTGGSTTADGSGNYSFMVDYGWTGTVTPSLAGYTFDPLSRDYTSVAANATGQDYTATLNSYSISGNAGVAGATITYTGGSTTADGSGNYSFMVDYGWTGTVTPTKEGYGFDPEDREYAGVAADQTAQDYTAGAGVDVTIGGTWRGSYLLSSGQSKHENYAGLDSGPVVVTSTTGLPIVAAIRDLWSDTTHETSSVQVMGLPASLLSTSYYFPAYNNVSLDDQIRFGNVGSAPTWVTVTIGGVSMGSYWLAPGTSQRVNYAGVDSGPVVVSSSGGVNIIASIRDSWESGGEWLSYAQLMGLPASQLSTSYYFPAYNNVSLDDQIRFGNVGTSPTNVTVNIGGTSYGPYYLLPNQSQRVSYAGVDSGPVVVSSSGGVKIIASIRDSWWDGTRWTSYSQLMGLPFSQLSTIYHFPVYENVGQLDGQLRFGNVGSAPTTVTVTIGGVVKGTYYLLPNASQRVTYAGLDAGPVRIESSDSVPIIASLRDSWWDGSVWTSYSQLMGLPNGQLSTSYYFPAYNNVSLDDELRIAAP